MKTLRLRKRPRSLRNKILLVTLSIAILVLSVCFVTLYQQNMNTLMHQYQDTTVLALSHTQVQLQHTMTTVENDLLEIQLNTDFLPLLSDSGANDVALSTLHTRRDFLMYLRSYLGSAHSGIVAAFTIDDKGNILGSSANRTMSLDRSDLWAEHYSDIISSNRFIWLGGYMDTDFIQIPDNEYYPLNSSPVLLCARRITASLSLPTRSALVMVLPISQIMTALSDFSLPSDSLCIIDHNGTQLIGTNQALNGSFITASTDESSMYTDDNGVDMHLITLPLSNGLRLVCMVPMEYYHSQMRPTLLYMLIIGICALLILSVGCVIASFSLERPLKHMVRVTERVSSGDMSARMDENPGVTEYGKLSLAFNNMLDSVSSLMERNVEIEREKRQLEIESLQAQINPHFLFNTITSLRWIAVMTQAESISNALSCLSQLMRPLFYNTGNQWSIREECDYIANYIYLMEMRFGSQISFSMNAQDEAMGSSIPRFTLQPILENSYEHSGAGRRHTNVLLSIVRESDNIVITISDDGLGMSPETLEQLRAAMLSGKRCASRSGSIGLANVYRRLKLFYGDSVNMTLDSQPGNGVRVTIRILDGNTGAPAR